MKKTIQFFVFSSLFPISQMASADCSVAVTSLGHLQPALTQAIVDATVPKMDVYDGYKASFRATDDVNEIMQDTSIDYTVYIDYKSYDSDQLNIKVRDVASTAVLFEDNVTLGVYDDEFSAQQALDSAIERISSGIASTLPKMPFCEVSSSSAK